MQCSIDIKRDMRDVIKTELDKTTPLAGSMSPAGESFELTVAFLREQLKHIHNPETMLENLQARTKALGTAFFTSLRRELGEEVYVTNGKSKTKHYVLGASVLRDPDAFGGIRYELRLAPQGNITDVKTAVVSLENDNIISGVAGNIEGLQHALTKATKSYAKKVKNAQVTKVTIDAEGDKDLKETLTRMTESDKILGSKKNRKAKDLQGYELVEDYTHGDIDSMKQILHKLHVLGGEKASAGLLKYYDSLLEQMHPRFFNNMKLYLKKKGRDSQGEVDFGKNRIAIELAPNRKTFQSDAEVYMHETIHSMMGWAMSFSELGVSKYKTQLNHAMDVAKKHTKWEDLLEVEADKATDAQIRHAKEMHEYIFANDNGTSVEEFIAYTMTNPRVMAHMKTIQLREGNGEKKTLGERISELFTAVLNMVMGKFPFQTNDLSVYEQVSSLSFKLAEINDKHLHGLQEMNPVGKMMKVLENTINDADNYLGEKLRTLRKKVETKQTKIKVPPADASLYKQAKFFLDVAVKSLTSPLHRGFLGLTVSAMGLKPDSSLREFMASLFTRDNMFRIAEKLNLLSNNIDASRNSVINSTHKSITSAFTRKLSKDEDTAITRVLLDSGLATLRYNRFHKNKQEDKDTVQMLTDEDFRHEYEGRVKAKIRSILGPDTERANWVIGQAVTLGHYLATHKAHVAQNFNGYNIVRGVGTNQHYTADLLLEQTVEELATVVALKHTSKKDKAAVAALIKEQPKGIGHITDVYETYRHNSLEQLFDNDKTHMMMGHTKELFDDSIDMQIAPVSKAEEMQAKGFTLAYTLPARNGDSYTTPMGMYTTGSWGKRERLRGTVGLGHLHSKGTTLTELKRLDNEAIAHLTFARDFAKISTKAQEIHAAMRKGVFDVTSVDYGMAPIVNKAGQVIDFRYMMNKELKEKSLGQDLRASQVLSRSAGSILHNVSRDKLNEEALAVIKQDMMNNWEIGSEIGKDQTTEYAIIGPEVHNDEMKTLFRMLPSSYQQFINSRHDKVLAVRKDLLRVYFGGAQMQTSDLIGIKLLPTVFKTMINTLEGLWMDIVKISKGAILLKMPMILVSNLVSNILFQIATGSIDIPQLFADYRDSFREVNEYINTNRRITRLNIEIASDKQALRRVKNDKALENIIYEKEVELKRLQNVLNQNVTKELFDAGMYQSHVEDLDASIMEDSNAITRYLDKKLEKLPKPVQWSANVAYITQNTLFYKASQEILQRTDMIARSVQNKREKRLEQEMMNGTRELPYWWLEDKSSVYGKKRKLNEKERKEFIPKAKAIRMQNLLDSYINYTLPNGKGEEYLNRMGILMFTKYVKRIQAVIANTTMAHPLKATLFALAGMTFLDADKIQDQALLFKGFDHTGDFSVFNIFPVYGIGYHLENVLTPPLIKEELRMGLF